MATPYDAQLTLTGDGPPLVLIPGMDGTGRLFYRQVPLLARRYRVATYRLRDDAPDMATLVEDLAQVARTTATTGDPVVVVGESFGGALALSFALAYPRHVAALVVLNSFPRFLPQRRLWLAIRALQLLPWEAMPVVRRLTAFRLHSRYTHRSEIRRFMELTRETSRNGYIARLRILRSYDIRDRLGELALPVLFLASERDHLVPAVREAQAMARRIPQAVVRVLPGHGHICLIAPNLDLESLLQDWRPRPR